MKPSHHPILEGKVKCSDCHNPHGALTPAMVKHESVNQQCFSCHADKRGPYMFGHPPVEENCLTCHTPHGSSHNKLLNEKVPNLCQDCHVQGRHPTAYYGQNQAWIGANGQPVTTREHALRLALVPELPQLDPRFECTDEPRSLPDPLRG